HSRSAEPRNSRGQIPRRTTDQSRDGRRETDVHRRLRSTSEVAPRAEQQNNYLGFFALASQSALALSQAFTHCLNSFSAWRRSTPRRRDWDSAIPHESVQLLCFSVQGSAVVAANNIMAHPLIMSAATEIFFFTL